MQEGILAAITTSFFPVYMYFQLKNKNHNKIFLNKLHVDVVFNCYPSKKKDACSKIVI